MEPPLPASANVKTRVVVLGSGWGAVSFVKQLSAGAGVDCTLVRHAGPWRCAHGPCAPLTRCRARLLRQQPS